jgi:cytochrome P450
MMDKAGEQRGVADYSFLDPAVQDDPFAFYELLQKEAPVYRMPENGFYIVTRDADARAVTRDTETFLNAIPARQGLAGERDALYQSVLREKGWPNEPTLNRCDGAVHTRYRKLVDRVFTAKRVRDLTPRLDELSNQIIDRFIDRGECEFVTEFALQLPGGFISEQLGLEADDVKTLKKWGDAFVAMRSRLLSEDEVRATAEVELECQHHLAKVFEARRKNPGIDILSGLVHAHEAGEQPLTMGELQGMAAQLLAAGFETTMSAIGHGLWLLLRYPDQMQKLRADRSLMRTFVDEVLRFDAPVHGIPRFTSRDTEVAGVAIPKGSLVMPRYGAANRDPEKFSCPHQFDVTRSDAGTHMSFGFGAHYCVGAQLARQEMISGFNAILDRMDDIALARPMPAPAHDSSFFLRPLKQLPITFRKVK